MDASDDKKPIFRLRDQQGDILKQWFYKQQLKPAQDPSTMEHKIERVIARRKINGKRHVLVKWMYYPAKVGNERILIKIYSFF